MFSPTYLYSDSPPRIFPSFVHTHIEQELKLISRYRLSSESLSTRFTVRLLAVGGGGAGVLCTLLLLLCC